MKHLLFLLLLSQTLLAEKKPNVIYILADDLGIGDLSIHGQKKFKTPHIDSIGHEGITFSAHYSGNTVCSPSRAVLMTGQHPGKVSIRGNLSEKNGGLLNPEQTILPEVFKAAGYATGAFGKWGLGHTNETGAANPLNHGFDEFCGWKSQTIAHTYYPTTYVHNGKEIPLEKGTYVHDLIMDQSMKFIERHAKEQRPFFCYIPTAVPHAAMHAPKHLHEKWRKVFPQFDHLIGEYIVHGGDNTETCEDVINPIAGFAAMMENLDNQVGEILNLLKTLNIDDNTLIIFTSDNGAHFEGGHDPDFWNSTGSLRGRKRDMHEGGIRTPMLARWPAVISPNRTSDHISAFWDILPTMCQIIGQNTPAQSDGISLLPTLNGQTDDQKKHEFLYFEFCRGPLQYITSQAVRKGKWKAYREFQKGRKGEKSSMKPLELYDLEKDPYEKNDLSKAQPKIVAEMMEIIKKAHTPLPNQPKAGATQ